MRYGKGNPIPEDAPLSVMRACLHHGMTEYRLITRSRNGKRARGYRCVRCNAENKARHRTQIRQQLIADAGGNCTRCGYDRCHAALQFHHQDPSTKSFELSKLSTNLAKARQEAAKCILLCANCHAEEHAGMM